MICLQLEERKHWITLLESQIQMRQAPLTLLLLELGMLLGQINKKGMLCVC